MQPALNSSLDMVLGLMAQELIRSSCNWFSQKCTPRVESTWQLLNQKQPVLACSANTKQVFKDLFLGGKDSLSLIPAQYIDKASFNPSARSLELNLGFTKPTLDAAHSFAAVLNEVGDKMKNVNDSIIVKGSGSLISFGSPTSNLITRTSHQFEMKEDELRGGIYIPNPAFDLKIRYELDADVIEKQQSPDITYQRIGVDGSVSTVTNWGIRLPNGEIMLPKTQNSRVVEDYLLISSLPNTFNLAACNNGHTAISFGGTHSEATRAIGKLFTNTSILKALCKKVKEAKTSYWQALIAVKCNPTDSSIGGVELDRIVEFSSVEVHPKLLGAMVEKNQKKLKLYKK
jgi:hypothetical protein